MLFKKLKSTDHTHEKNHPLDIAILQSVYNNCFGDYLEFGVNKGNSFVRSYKTYEKYIKYYNKKFKTNFQLPSFYAFDLFEEGVPNEQLEESKHVPYHWKNDLWQYPVKQFIKNCEEKKLNMSNINIEKGLFEKTLKNFNKSIIQASVIFFDCDFKKPTLEALNFSKKFIKEGSILVFDDYFRFRGCKELGPHGAFIEFLNQNENEIEFRDFGIYRGQIASYICSGTKKNI